MKRAHLFLMFGALLFGCGEGTVDSNGEDSADIIGGATDQGDQSVVALFAHLPGQSQGSLCTATVISPTVLLTAAHCVDPDVVGAGNQFQAIVGTSLNAPQQTLAVTRTAFDPAFNVNQLQNGHDVGIAVLAKATTLKPVPFNKTALAANLVGQSVRLVGFGVNAHGGTGAGTKRTDTVKVDALISNNLVKLGNSNNQTCHGDSGGPALLKINGVETIIGLTSFGQDFSATNECFNGGVDTRVDAVQAFIAQNLK